MRESCSPGAVAVPMEGAWSHPSPAWQPVVESAMPVRSPDRPQGAQFVSDSEPDPTRAVSGPCRVPPGSMTLPMGFGAMRRRARAAAFRASMRPVLTRTEDER
jgi:hypothetical protein